jgi:hypothetical protein
MRGRPFSVLRKGRCDGCRLFRAGRQLWRHSFAVQRCEKCRGTDVRASWYEPKSVQGVWDITTNPQLGRGNRRCWLARIQLASVQNRFSSAWKGRHPQAPRLVLHLDMFLRAAKKCAVVSRKLRQGREADREAAEFRQGRWSASAESWKGPQTHIFLFPVASRQICGNTTLSDSYP